jgi:hypothetical protein
MRGGRSNRKTRQKQKQIEKADHGNRTDKNGQRTDSGIDVCIPNRHGERQGFSVVVLQGFP